MAKHNKPPKPFKEYPLFAHNNGMWAKKVNGDLHYFGSWKSDRTGQAALQQYRRDADALHAGEQLLRVGAPSKVTVKEICDLFLDSKRKKMEAGELSARTWEEYQRACLILADFFGRQRRVATIAPSEFGDLRAELSKKNGPHGLTNKIGKIRMVFRFASEEGYLDKAMRFGQSFDKPSQRVMRAHRQASGKKLFEPQEIRVLMDAATMPMKAFILLGINCAFGQTDCASLPQSAIQGDWLEFPRPKTAIERRIPLWEETAAALDEAIASRPKPLDEADSGLCFLTRQGRRWVRENDNFTPNDEIGKAFMKLMRAVDNTNKDEDGNLPDGYHPMQRPGRGFYAFRHTFQTVADDATALYPAVKAIMGHVDESMSGTYRERISEERLLEVTGAVHKWLFG